MLKIEDAIFAPWREIGNNAVEKSYVLRLRQSVTGDVEVSKANSWQNWPIKQNPEFDAGELKR